jgi:DivIVA domain-containing protein
LVLVGAGGACSVRLGAAPQWRGVGPAVAGQCRADGPVAVKGVAAHRGSIGNNGRMVDFPRAWRGYARHQVDALIARIEGTLGRSPLFAPPVTADEVNSMRFGRAMRGYRMKAVDHALEAYVRELEDKAGGNRMRPGEVDRLIGLVRNVQFGTTRLNVGYDEREVDHFLDKTIIALQEGRARASEVKKAVFASTRARPGYRQPEVDAFLERLASEIERLRSTG